MQPTEAVTVLYMEDEVGLARLFQKKLNREGFEVDLAPDGIAGLEKYSQGSYNIVLVDHRMPGLNGLEVIQRLAEKPSPPAMIMLTGAGSEKIAVEAMKLGANDYIVKDMKGKYFQLMPVVIRRVMEQRRLEEDKCKAEEALLEAYNNLEIMVEERTAELVKANKKLESEIVERQKAQLQLEEARQNLEQQVKERTRELEDKTDALQEMNAALNVLLKKRESDQTELQENILSNTQSLIFPYIEKLKNLRLSSTQSNYVEIIESNLNEMVSPFANSLSSKYFGLTPTEIRVASLIKQDKTTKEIADINNTSESAIVFHRHNIRKKLGLHNKKINLKAFLQSIS